MFQTIDYTQYPDLSQYLSEHHSSKQFDTIIDTAESDPSLYRNSPKYLEPDGCFAFGGNMSTTHKAPGSGVMGAISWVLHAAGLVLGCQLQSMCPIILGGTPRRSFFHSSNPNARNISLVRKQMEDGSLKVPSTAFGKWKTSLR